MVPHSLSQWFYNYDSLIMGSSFPCLTSFMDFSSPSGKYNSDSLNMTESSTSWAAVLPKRPFLIPILMLWFTEPVMFSLPQSHESLDSLGEEHLHAPLSLANSCEASGWSHLNYHLLETACTGNSLLPPAQPLPRPPPSPTHQHHLPLLVQIIFLLCRPLRYCVNKIE